MAAAFALFAVAVFLPEVVSAAWHVAHGETVTFRGWKVNVPFEWFARSQGEDMTVERMTRLSWLPHPVVVFEPSHFTRQYHFQSDVYAKSEALVMKGKGYLPSGQRTLEIAGADGLCWTFDSSASPNNVWISCIVPKELTSADYSGPKDYAASFFSLLQQIKPAKP
ncbi:MAG TPA: hypothetical protein VGR81_04355 [Candidatus Acidoferrales bacterium]|nr:hypothetical protein [Candidatus Acidoferrales bacterium]